MQSSSSIPEHEVEYLTIFRWCIVLIDISLQKLLSVIHSWLFWQGLLIQCCGEIIAIWTLWNVLMKNHWNISSVFSPQMPRGLLSCSSTFSFIGHFNFSCCMLSRLVIETDIVKIAKVGHYRGIIEKTNSLDW